MTMRSLFNGGRAAADLSMEWHSTEPWVRFGMRTVACVSCGLLAGSIVFSVSDTVVATGTVSAEGEYKTVQHSGGATVAKILVRNGDRVQAGDILIRVDDSQARANVAAETAKLNAYAIQEARLLAERDRRHQFEAPESIDMTDAANISFFEAEKARFEKRRTAYLSELNAMNERIAQIDSRLSIVNVQLEARNKELVLNELELSNARPMFDRGSVTVKPIGPLQRENVRIRSELIDLNAQIEKLKSERPDVEARLLEIERDFKRRVEEELKTVQTRLAEQTEKRKAGTGSITLSDIVAPATGIVHDIAMLTEGNVIQSGIPLLQIVPEDRKLMVEARIKLREGDQVQIGQPATVRFSPFDSHVTTRLEGIVREISAAEVNGTERLAIYTTQIEVPPEEILKHDAGHRVVPGMPAEVYVETQARSILSYVLQPLTDLVAPTFPER